MAKTSRERVRKWREKKAKEGGRNLSTWLEPETARMLDRLLKHYGETVSPVIARAIAALYNETIGESEELLKAEQDPAGDRVVAVTRDEEAKKTAAVEILPGKSEALEEAAGEASLSAGESAVEDETDVVLSEIRRQLAAGIAIKELHKTLLVDWIKFMQKRGASFSEMADILNEAGIPTLTGRGRWEQGMIPTVLILSAL